MFHAICWQKHKFLHGFAQRGRNQQSNQFNFLSNRCGRMSIFCPSWNLLANPYCQCRACLWDAASTSRHHCQHKCWKTQCFYKVLHPRIMKTQRFFNIFATPEKHLSDRAWNPLSPPTWAWTFNQLRCLWAIRFCLHFAADVWTKNLSRSIEVLRIGLPFHTRLVWKLFHISFSRLPVTKLKLMAAETFWTKSGFAWIWKEIVRNQFDSRCQAKDILEPRKKSSHTI